MTSPWKILGATVAAFICTLTGAYILWQFHTTPGLIGGVALVLFGVAIALPTPFTTGAVTLKGGLVLVVPVIMNAVDALKGGSRKTDPPADTKSDTP